MNQILLRNYLSTQKMFLFMTPTWDIKIKIIVGSCKYLPLPAFVYFNSLFKLLAH